MPPAGVGGFQVPTYKGGLVDLEIPTTEVVGMVLVLLQLTSTLARRPRDSERGGHAFWVCVCFSQK